MNILEKKTQINVVFLVVLIFMTLSRLGVFKEVESWFSHEELSVITIDSGLCSYGSGEDGDTYICDTVYFMSLDTNQWLDGKCVGDCALQRNLLSPGIIYRIEVTDFPFVGKRILSVKKER